MIPAGLSRLAGLALVLVLLPGMALSQPWLAGDWRPRGDDTADPALVAVDCAPEDQDCAAGNGTFVSDLFLRIMEDDATGALSMTSSGALSATLAARAGGGRGLDVAMAGGGTATLHPRSQACGVAKACFEIVGSTDPATLPDGVYWSVVPLLSDDKLGMSLQDRFGSVPPNMDLAGHCYDITKMGLDTFTDQQGCRQQIFKKFSDIDPKDYKVTSFGDEKMVAIPYGWKYLPIAKTYGADRARILDSASDVSDSHAHSVGMNVTAGLGPVNFSASTNTTTGQRAQDMYEKSLTYAEYHYIKTDFALVVDKANAQLSAPFYAAITQAAKAAEPDFGAIIAEFGTHYAYGTTMGERGRLFSIISSENVAKLHDQSVDVSTAMSVGMSVPIGELGEAKAGVGRTDDTKDDHLAKMAGTLGDNFGSYVCEGGLSCNGTNASGGVSVPVLLDLRPLSDLLAPPFFSEIDDLPALQAGFAKAIADYAFAGTPASDEAAAKFVELVGVNAWDCDGFTQDNPDFCFMTKITAAGPATLMEFADGTGWRSKVPGSPSIVFLPGAGPTLTFEAWLDMDGRQACNMGPGAPPLSGRAAGSVGGSLSVPTDLAAFESHNWWFNFPMPPIVCPPPNTEAYYEMTVQASFSPVSAAQILLH